jgi:5-methylcytosine-specific restriction endonuclease McrA
MSKRCGKCGGTEFYARSTCKVCQKRRAAARNKRLRAEGTYYEDPAKRRERARRWAHAIGNPRKRGYTPAWSDTAAIKAFYMACPEGHQVDHIVPLQGETVSGLHVLANLQYLTPTENKAKGNTWQSHN